MDITTTDSVMAGVMIHSGVDIMGIIMVIGMDIKTDTGMDIMMEIMQVITITIMITTALIFMDIEIM